MELASPSLIDETRWLRRKISYLIVIQISLPLISKLLSTRLVARRIFWLNHQNRVGKPTWFIGFKQRREYFLVVNKILVVYSYI